MTQPDPDNLLELAALCEAAEGPDRELDTRIAHATAWRWDGWCEGDIAIEERDLDYVIGRVLKSWNSIYRNIPEFTASLDAATSLFPTNTFYRSGHDGAGPDVTLFYCEAIGTAQDGRPLQGVRSVAMTEALARAACALRARARSSNDQGRAK